MKREDEILIVNNSGYLGNNKPVIREINDNHNPVEPLYPIGIVVTDENEINDNGTIPAVEPLYPVGFNYQEKE